MPQGASEITGDGVEVLDRQNKWNGHVLPAVGGYWSGACSGSIVRGRAGAGAVGLTLLVEGGGEGWTAKKYQSPATKNVG